MKEPEDKMNISRDSWDKYDIRAKQAPKGSIKKPLPKGAKKLMDRVGEFLGATLLAVLGIATIGFIAVFIISLTVKVGRWGGLW